MLRSYPNQGGKHLLLEITKSNAALHSAALLALSSIGDAFLYVALPAYATELKVPVVWVGVLLSINRFVRLFSNHAFVSLFQRFGFRRIGIAAAVLAALTTLTYGLASALVVWIIARIVWGFCFSALRMSTIAYSLSGANPGLSLGIGKGFQELGAIFALLLGPLLTASINPQATFLIFAMISATGIAFASSLPEIKNFNLLMRETCTEADAISAKSLLPTPINTITFLSAFVVQGIIIVSMVKLLAPGFPGNGSIVVIAGFFLAYRRICSLVLAPVGGMYADKWGINQVHLVSILMTAIGLLFLVNGYVGLGLVTTFTFNSVSAALSPGHSTKGHRSILQAVASNNSWSDMGAATGILAAGLITTALDFSLVFFSTAAVLAGISILQIGKVQLGKVR